MGITIGRDRSGTHLIYTRGTYGLIVFSESYIVTAATFAIFAEGADEAELTLTNAPGGGVTITTVGGASEVEIALTKAQGDTLELGTANSGVWILTETLADGPEIQSGAFVIDEPGVLP